VADVPTFAVIPTFGRPCFEQSAKSVIPQVERTFVIKTEPFEMAPGTLVDVVEDYVRPKNISRWWNHGIRGAQVHARLLGASAWNVLVMNDDVIACPQLVRKLRQGLRHRVINDEPCMELRAQIPVLAYPDNFAGSRFAFNRTAGPVDITTRISGWCFMIRGESGLQANEHFEWFYGDDDLDWTAREMGGAVMVPGCAVEHLHPNEETARRPELTARTHVDRELFLAKWGRTPH
jgi:hypothetical protein